MASLSDQLLKAGLTNQKKAKQAAKAKKQQEHAKRHNQENEIDETKVQAELARSQKADRARELNKQQKQEADDKAIAAQIKQLIQSHKLEKNKGDVAYQFSDVQLKKIYVNETQQEELSHGLLAIVKLEENQTTSYELVPAKTAQKIAQRNEACVLVLNKQVDIGSEKEDPYADRQIPDDLMW